MKLKHRIETSLSLFKKWVDPFEPLNRLLAAGVPKYSEHRNHADARAKRPKENVAQGPKRQNKTQQSTVIHRQ